MIKISIANDFSIIPGGRFYTDGPFSAEEFTNTILIPKLITNSDIIELNFDNTRGFGSSFLYQLIYELKSKFNREYIENRIKFKSKDESIIEELNEYLEKSLNENF